jgi:hypothetical protein
MYVVELFLPLDAKDGEPIEPHVFEGIVRGLTDRFGGATAFTREMAEGLWKRATTIEPDRIIVVEVVVEDVHEDWWRSYRQRLENLLGQDEILVRITTCRTLPRTGEDPESTADKSQASTFANAAVLRSLLRVLLDADLIGSEQFHSVFDGAAKLLIEHARESPADAAALKEAAALIDQRKIDWD